MTKREALDLLLDQYNAMFELLAERGLTSLSDVGQCDKESMPEVWDVLNQGID